MKYQILITLLGFILVVGCKQAGKSSSNKGENFGKNIVELINEGYYSIANEDSNNLYSMLNSIILSDSNSILFKITDSIVENSELIIPNFEKITISRDDKFLRDLYMFEVCLHSVDTLIINGKPSDLNKMDSLVKEYYFLCEDESIPVKQKADSISIFGVIQIPELIYSLYANVKYKDGLSDNEWDTFYKCIKSIFGTYDELRNELSFKHFGKAFNSLTFEEKKAILSLRPLKIIVHLNMGCVLNKLPPLNDPIIDIED